MAAIGQLLPWGDLMASRMASGALPVASAAAGDLAGRVKLVPGSMEGCESALPFADLNLVAAQEIGEIAPEFIEGGLNFPGADDDEVGSGPLDRERRLG